MLKHCTFLAFGIVTLVTPALPAQPMPRTSKVPEGARLRLGATGIGKGEPIVGGALSPDGKILAIVGRDALTLLERDSGKPLARINGVPPGVPVVFSPDGKRLAYGDRQNLILADVPAGNPVHTLSAPESEIARPMGLSFSGNGKLVAVGGQAMTTKTRPVANVWNTSSGDHVATFAVAQNIACMTALAPDGKCLATWGRHAARMIGDDDEAGKVVQLWDVATGKERRALKIDRPNAQVHAVAFSPDGKTLAVACGMSYFHLFDVDSGRELRRFAGRSGFTRILQFSPDGKLLVAGNNLGVIQAWHLADGTRLTLPPGPRNEVVSLAFGAKEQILALYYTMQGVFCWDARVGLSGQQTGHVAPVLAVAFAADGQALTSASADGVVLQWDAHSGTLLKRAGIVDEQLLAGPTQSVRLNTLALSPDSRYAATNTIYPNIVRLWDLRTGQPACDFETVKTTGALGIAFSPRGDRLMTAGMMKQINVWDVATGQELAKLGYDAAGALQVRGVPRLLFAPDGKTLAVALATVDGMSGAPWGHVLLLDAVNGKERLGVDAPPPAATGQGATPTIAFSLDSKRLALPGPNGSLALVHVETGKEWKRLETPGGFIALTALAFSPDGRTLALAHGGLRDVGPMGELTSTAAVIELWELASGQRRALYRGQQGATNCLAFAPDGLTLASGSADTTVVLWDVTGGSDKPAAAVDAEWAALAKADAAAAFRAEGRLIASRAETVTFLAKQLRPAQVSAVDPKQLAEWVANLDSEDFNARTLAFDSLEKLGASTEATLRLARTGKISLEMRRRIDDLLDKVERGTRSAEELQALRAVEVLERIGTPPARELLTTLATGAEAAVLTREARQALTRLTR